MELEPTITRLRGVTKLPICVGFGISNASQAATVGKLADGIVVGSALMQAAGRSVSEAIELGGSLRAALDA
jgi:tryptophan synthase alpha chain